MQKKMNICIPVRALPVHINGGMEKHTFTLAQGLAKRGHNVHIVTSAHPNYLSYENIDNLRIHYLPGTVPGKYSLSFWQKLNKKIDELNNEYKFDIIHFQGFTGLTYALRKNKRYIVTIHGTLFSETLLYYPVFSKFNFIKKISLIYRYKSRILIYPLYKKMLSNAERIIVDSNFTRIELEGQNPKHALKIDIVPLGIGLDDLSSPSKHEARKKLGFGGSEFVIFTVGRIDETKGIYTAIDSIKILNEKGNDVKYLIGGSGGLKEELEKYCRVNKLENIKFVGYIEDVELPQYYAAADIFLYPEITAPAFGLVAIESMRCGTPVLGSSRGAIPEIVKENVGWTFYPGDPIDLANKIHFLIHNQNEIAAKSEITKKYIEENFSIERMISKTISVYEKVAECKT